MYNKSKLSTASTLFFSFGKLWKRCWYSKFDFNMQQPRENYHLDFTITFIHVLKIYNFLLQTKLHIHNPPISRLVDSAVLTPITRPHPPLPWFGPFPKITNPNPRDTPNLAPTPEQGLDLETSLRLQRTTNLCQTIHFRLNIDIISKLHNLEMLTTYTS